MCLEMWTIELITLAICCHLSVGKGNARIVSGLAQLLPKLASFENTELHMISDFKVSLVR